MNIEQVIADCAQAMRSGVDASSVINTAIAQYPGHASLFFLRASELAEAGNFTSALDDFATALVLEPEFHLARLQYIFCSISLKQIAALPVLLQPLLQLDDCAVKYYAKSLMAVLENNPDQRDVMLDTAAQYADNIAPLTETVRRLGLDIPETQLLSSAEAEQNGVISSILLEIYKRSH
jgi:thioredoxin-like negative regulator of GroEL